MGSASSITHLLWDLQQVTSPTQAVVSPSVQVGGWNSFPKGFNCLYGTHNSPRTLKIVSASRVRLLTLTHKILDEFLAMEYAHTNGLTVSYRDSGHRPFTNVVLSLTHRISGCDSG